MTKTPEELTDDWKAGKLEFGKDYYIKTVYDEVLIDCYEQQYDESHYPHGMGFDNFSKNMIKRILAPVPTYDEYKAMHAAIQNGESAIDTNKRLCEKIENLGYLLKECKEWFECFAWNKEYKHKSVNILARINAALGESEE